MYCFIFKGREATWQATGYSWDDLAPCVMWMAPMASVVKREPVPDVLPSISGCPDETRHLLQSHCISLQMLVRMHILLQNFFNVWDLCSIINKSTT